MTQEEKAKLYDELKVKAQELTEDGYIDKLALVDMFPELKESEDDSVRKALIEFVQGMYTGCRTEEACKERDMYLAWLEKGEKEAKGNEREIPSSEQKPADKVEPKFHEGDWITIKE